MVSILGSFDGVKSKKSNKDDIQYVYYKEIRPAQKNRNIGNINDLAEDIAEDGLDHNLILTKIDDEDYKYEIVAGHRRFMAICLNIKNGDKTYEYIPAKIKNYDEIDALRRLHLNNINTKPYTPGEMMEAIEDLRKIYEIKKRKGEKEPGRIQELIAKDVGLKKSQVGNYEKVLKNGIDEVKDKLKNDEITLNEALEIVEMDDENQMKFIEDSNGDISLTTIKDYKESLCETDTNNEKQNLSSKEIVVPEIKKDEIDEDKSFEEQENNNINHSVQGLVVEIQTNLCLLKNKINGVEWKKEQAIVKEILELITVLKKSAGI